ncbi:MAG: hypothetical protein IT529_06280 [Burkholderiales bacterium]|nr:hypothetical protein [Burkholderiales bacterium]
MRTAVSSQPPAASPRRAREPDRLGDAIVQIAAQMLDHGVNRCEIAVRRGKQVSVFELRHQRTTDHWIPGERRPQVVAGVLLIETTAKDG